MYDAQAFTTAMDELAELLPQDGEPAQVLADLSARMVDVLRIHGCAIALVGAATPRFVTATTPELMELERLQELHQAGPAIEAVTTRSPVAVNDVGEGSERWPAYAETARQEGYGAVVSVPLNWGGQGVGVVDVFAAEPREWTSTDLRMGHVIAEVATGFLVSARGLLDAQRLSSQLQTALDSRVIIEQAKGMVAQARAVTPDQAFELIRTNARRRQLGLHEVARAIVNEGRRP